MSQEEGNIQSEYFLTGDERKLRPMILKDIADTIQMDVSTVSRVALSPRVESSFGSIRNSTNVARRELAPHPHPHEGPQIGFVPQGGFTETLVRTVLVCAHRVDSLSINAANRCRSAASSSSRPRFSSREQK